MEMAEGAFVMTLAISHGSAMYQSHGRYAQKYVLSATPLDGRIHAQLRHSLAPDAPPSRPDCGCVIDDQPLISQLLN
jgi:hypothetical protein